MENPMWKFSIVNKRIFFAKNEEKFTSTFFYNTEVEFFIFYNTEKN